MSMCGIPGCAGDKSACRVLIKCILKRNFLASVLDRVKTGSGGQRSSHESLGGRSRLPTLILSQGPSHRVTSTTSPRPPHKASPEPVNTLPWVANVTKLKNLSWGDYPGGPSVITKIFQRGRQEAREEKSCHTAAFRMEKGTTSQGL